MPTQPKELTTGDTAPDFTLLASNEEQVSLSKLKSKWIVLYFYPKDDTPGCTKEACSFRDTKEKFAKKNAVVFGVSADHLESHEKFVDKYNLNFLLLSDTDTKVCKDYGVYKNKITFGIKALGIERSTFLIDPTGKIKKVWRRVQVDGHEEEVLKCVSLKRRNDEKTFYRRISSFCYIAGYGKTEMD